MSRLLDVTLDEATHTYTDANKVQYTPVSTILAAYKEKFDPYKQMPNGGTLVGNYVQKHGFTEEYWISQWDGTRDRACTRGSAFHKVKETVHNGLLQVERPNIFPVQYFSDVVDRNPGIDYSQLPNGSYRELTLFNRSRLIAGQADNVIIEDGYFDIDDDKTNGEFKTESFKPPRGSHKMMAYPLNRLMDCHLYHYTMQLSLYAWMLEQFGLKARTLRLLHYLILEEDEKKILRGEQVNIEPAIYTVRYEKELVERMLKHYLTTVRRNNNHGQ